MKSKRAIISIAAVGAVAASLCPAAKAGAADAVVFKIWNDTTVPVVELYDKDSRQDNWGINDLSKPIPPGHYFFIKFTQNSYAHCPGMMHDVKLVFAGGKVKVLTKVPVCEYDVHVNHP